MGLILIPLFGGIAGAALAYYIIGGRRLWEAALAALVGFVFTATALYFILSAVGNALLPTYDDTVIERETVAVADVTSRMTTTTEYESEDADNGTVTLRPTSGATSSYSYVNLHTGDIEEVPARGTLIMVGDIYDDQLIIVTERFAPGTWPSFLFGDNMTIQERVFQLEEPPNR